MVNYWPRRSSPEGFSIEKLAKNYRDKISKLSFESMKSTYKERKSFQTTEKINCFIRISDNRHWANREFYEYYDVS